MDLRAPLALAAASAALVAGPASPAAAAAPCGAPSLASVLYETPDVLVVRGPAKRVGRRGKARVVSACDRRSGRRTPIGVDRDGPGANQDAHPIGLHGGRWLLVSTTESRFDRGPRSFARVVDIATGRVSRRGELDMAGASGLFEATRAGMLLASRGPRGVLAIERPGEPSRVLARGELTDVALGAGTAYWRTGDRAVASAAAPAELLAATSVAAPLRRAGGACEPRGSRTLLRSGRGRLLRSVDGSVIACRAGRAPLDLRAALPGSVAAGPVEDVRLIGLGLVGYRYEVEGGTALAVVDVKKARVLHAAVIGDVPAEIDFHASGIALTGPGGLRLIRRLKVLTVDATGPATDPALTSDTDGGRIVFWTTPSGPRAKRL